MGVKTTSWLRLSIGFTFCFKAVLSAIQPPLLLILSLDGFRHDFYDNYSTPNLHKIAEEGVRAPWINNVFPTNTLPNHFAIATGLYAESHGFVNNVYYDPTLGRTVDYYNESYTPDLFDISAVPLWILNQEQTSGYSGCVMWPGSDLSFHNRTAFYVMSRNETITFQVTTFTEKIALTISYFKNETHPANVVFLYGEEPDLISHLKGPYSKEVRNNVVVMDQYVGDLIVALQEAGLYDRMNLIITGDHGQEEYTTDNIRVLDTFLDSQLYDIDVDEGVTLGIFPKGGNLEQVYESLAHSPWNKQVYDVYKKADIPADWHYSHNDRILPILLVARPGYFIQQTRKPDKYGPKLGTHGYPNTYHAMHPFFVARGPSFKQGYKSQPFDMVDIYPLMCHILGLEPAPNNGSLDAVMDLLKQEEAFPISSNLILIATVVISVVLLAVVSVIIRQAVVRRRRLRGKPNRCDVTYSMVDKEEIQILTSDDEFEV